MTFLGAPVLLGVSLKMYFDAARTAEWCTVVADIARCHDAILSGTVSLFVMPGFTSLAATVKTFAGTPVAVGAQDLFWEDRGPFTGEVSGADLRDAGCSLAEIGHAERRGIFAETEAMFGKKMAAAVRNSLVPVLCVGEAEQGSAAEAAANCISQLEKIFEGQEDGARSAAATPIIVAYEPEWAIGAEQAASPAHVSAVSLLLRQWLGQRPGSETSRVIYGGSAGPGLLTELGTAVDGLFLGRFAHDPTALKLILDEALLMTTMFLDLHRRRERN